MSSPIVYLNGEFLPENQALIPISDRGFLFGDGVFTTIKIANGKPEFLTLHLKKLEEDCRQLKIVPRVWNQAVIHELIQRNDAMSGIWRLKILVSGGNSKELHLRNRSEGTFLITLNPYAGHPSPCRLALYPHSVSRVLAAVKSLSFLDHLVFADHANKRGFHDALLCDPQGFVLETSIANLFWRHKDSVFFPDPSLPVYPGITLRVILGVFKKMGINCHPVKARLDDFPNEGQIYLCNSMKGFVPVIAIEEKNFQRDLPFEDSLYKAYFSCNMD